MSDWPTRARRTSTSRSSPEAGEGGQQIERDSLPEDGGRVDDQALIALQAVEVAQDRLGEGGGQRQAGQLVDAALSRGQEQLLQEERVARGAPVQVGGRGVGSGAAPDRGDQRPDLLDAEPAQGQVLHLMLAFDGRQQVGHVAAVEVLGPVGPDQQDRQLRRRGQVAEQAQALGVGPVEVLEHDQARARRRPGSGPTRWPPGPARRPNRGIRDVTSWTATGARRVDSASSQGRSSGGTRFHPATTEETASRSSW